ncbi:glycoside hydrolase family 3 protein [Candidatus Latescibacterota bacterium]
MKHTSFFAHCMIAVFCAVLMVSCAKTLKEPMSFLSYDRQANEVLTGMTLDEKIGQMIQTDYVNLEDISDIEKYYLGSLLFAGSSDPEEGNSLEAWTDAYDKCQKAAVTTRLGIPLIFGVDAIHGHSNVLGAVIFPHNIGLGCTNNPGLVEEIGRITALEMRATGLNWTFAPCVTVPRDERWGRTYEGFSEDPGIASVLGEASTRGLQGNDLSNPLSVAACAKHYIADGGTTAREFTPRPRGNQTSNNFGAFPMARNRGPRIMLNAGDAQIDEETLRSVHLPPYKAAVKAGVATVMPSYSSWNGVKCSGHKYLLTDVLKDELGFEGFIISDYSAIGMLDRDYKTAIGISINAGMDMGMIPRRYREFFTNLKELVEEGVVPVSRIDDAVRRILRVKFAMGLMDKRRSPLADRNLHQSFGIQEHREVARDAVRQSLVLLKNEGSALPISKQISRIHVAGKSADNIGNMCGGWTIEWQGQSGDVTTGGTTVLTAIKNTVSNNTNVTFSNDGSGADGADIGIVVIGETPYAEGTGDNGTLALNEEDIAAVNNMKNAGIPVVVILISGRPMIINDVLEEADAFIAAWLPGTEGQGVADILFGDYKPTGKLSYTWPRSVEQIPINIGDSDYDPLFEFGYGLTY